MALLAAAEPASRSVPTRPATAAPVSGRLASLPVTRILGVEFVPLREGAAMLGLKTMVAESPRKFILADPPVRVELEADSREMAVNGLRVFLGDPTVWRGGQLYMSRIDFERRLTPMVRPAFGPACPPPPRVIALDPGHGLPDNGFENEKFDLKERILTLDVAQRLKKLLEAKGYRVVLTRTDDRALSPEKKIDFPLRDQVANRASADLFVSIHFNSLFPDTKTSGTEIYTFAPRMQHAADWWGDTRKEDPDVEREEASVNRYDFWSVVLAQALHRSVLASLRTADRGAKLKHLGVLRNLDCPGVLVESVFLSNDGEAKRAATPAYRQQIAEALAAGIGAYAGTLETLRPKPVAPPAASPQSSDP